MTFSSLLEHLHKLSLHPTEEVKELSSKILDQLIVRNERLLPPP